MSPRIIFADELRQRVLFTDLIEPMANAFRAVSAGTAQNGQITLFPAESTEAGDVYVKAGAIPGRELYIVKIAPWFSANVQQGRPQGGFVAAFDARSGHMQALFQDEHYLSDIRTAAAGALSARLFVPSDFQTAAVIGAGTQAKLQVLALYGERRFHRLFVWARNGVKALAFAEALGHLLPEIEIEVAPSTEAAVRACDVLITATVSRDPVVHGDWLHEGQHVTAVGADDPTKCELDRAALARARVFVDERATSASNGDIFRAIKQGAEPKLLITGEIGEVLRGTIPGRRSAQDITIAKLVGVGAQDLLAAERALELIDLPRHSQKDGSLSISPKPAPGTSPST